jgi:hypothetical protein
VKAVDSIVKGVDQKVEDNREIYRQVVQAINMEEKRVQNLGGSPGFGKKAKMV